MSNKNKDEIDEAMEKQKESKKEEPKTEGQEKSKEQELIEDLQRIQAEFENFKKRSEKENAEFREYAKTELISRLLPVLDNLELALSNTDKEQHEEFVKGIELIFSQLFTVLEDEGLQKIDAKDKRFDPFLHEALLAERSDKEEGTVLEELQKGYFLKERVIRHTKVKVAKKE